MSEDAHSPIAKSASTNAAAARDSSGAILVAAGASRRMGAGANKVLLELRGEPVLVWSARALAAHVRELVVVARGDEIAVVEAALVRAQLACPHRVVAGGAERADSVRAGLAALGASCRVVLVHDAARPLVDGTDVAAVLEAARSGAAILAVAVTDTIKRSTDGRTTRETVDRDQLWAAQTPQGFDRAQLEELHRRAEVEGVAATDDAALWERWIGPVELVPARSPNLKVTRPEDLVLAEALLDARLRAAKR